jgi:hypothetical protein
MAGNTSYSYRVGTWSHIIIFTKRNYMKESYGTLSETVNGLKEDGYTLDFNIQKDCIICHRTNISLCPEEFEIDKVYRFEGASDPDDSAIVYAISAPKLGVKGVLVNAYGVYADDASAALVARLHQHH